MTARARTTVVNVLGGCAALLAVGDHPLAAQSIAVDVPVRVSPLGAGTHWYTTIVSSPGDAQQLIACGIRNSPVTGDGQGFVYHSDDGGAHWVTAVIDSTPGRNVSETNCAFGLDGQAYFIAQTWNLRHEWPRLGGGVVRFYRSLDAGRTWTPTFVDPTPTSWMDYAHIGVDLTRSSYRGRVYVFSNASMDGRTMLGVPQSPSRPMRYSVDGGIHFSDRITLPLVKPVTAGGFPEAVQVLSSGTVVAAYSNRYRNDGRPFAAAVTDPNAVFRNATFVQVVRSTNGGRTLEPPITVARGLGCFPRLAVDTSTGPYRGRLYIVFETADTAAHVWHTLLVTSDDEGRTWTAPRIVDDWDLVHHAVKGRRDETANIDWWWKWPGAHSPHAVVNRNGVLGLSWNEDHMCWRFTASLDGGRTFLPSSPVACLHSAAAYDYREQLVASADVVLFDPGTKDLMRKGFSVGVASGGGAEGITADADGVFHPLWNIWGRDARLWTTRVTVSPSGPASAPPVPSTAGLTDVSPHVTYRLTEPDYDPATGLVTVALTLINMDSVAIRGPLRIEVTRLGSMLFRQVEVVSADNHAAGAGAVWDMSALLPGGVLGAYATASPRRVVFHVAEGPQPIDVRAQWSATLVVADVKIFASP